MKDKVTLKGLQTQLSKLQGEMEVLRANISVNQRELNTKQQAAKKLQERIKHLSGEGDLIVSEHAMLRWLERVHGINMKDIEREILSDEVLRMTSTLGGSGTYPNGKYSLVIKNNVVVTVKEDK